MTTLSEDEVKLYDRQIRLWGIEAQKRISCARVAVLGLHPIEMEAAKNLAAAGVNLVLVDQRIWTPDCALIVPPPTDFTPTKDQTVAEVYKICLRGMNSHIKIDVCTLEEFRKAQENLSAVICSLDAASLASVQSPNNPSAATAVVQSLSPFCVMTAITDKKIFLFKIRDAKSANRHDLKTLLNPEALPSGSRKIPLALKALRECTPCQNDGTVGFAEAAILGGLIAQQIRQKISQGDGDGEWNVACFDRVDCSVSVAAHPPELKKNSPPPKPTALEIESVL